MWLSRCPVGRPAPCLPQLRWRCPFAPGFDPFSRIARYSMSARQTIFCATKDWPLVASDFTGACFVT